MLDSSFGARFGALVRKKRRELRLTQESLAADVYGSFERKGDISRLENGRVPRPQAHTMQRFAQVLGITTEEIESCYLTRQIASETRTVKRMEVFICHATEDKPVARELFRNLARFGFRPWLDEENLIVGDDWEYEIQNAVKRSHAVVVLLSGHSTTKEGFVQKEIRIALDAAAEKPEGTNYLLPVLVEECVLPKRLELWHCLRLHEEGGRIGLVRALTKRARQVRLDGALPQAWKLESFLLHVDLATMSQDEIRDWLAAVGDDSEVFPEEHGSEWPKTYRHAVSLLERLLRDVAEL